MKLPKLNNVQRLLQTYQVQFGGLNHTEGALDGDIYDMKNMASDHYPVLCPRNKRKTIASITNPGGFYSYCGVLVYISDNSVYVKREGVANNIGTVTAGEKVFAAMQNKIFIFPDKMYVDLTDDTLHYMAVTLTAETVTFKAEGSLYGEKAENNTIYIGGDDFDFHDHFKVGDAIFIEGCDNLPNDKSAIIREVEKNYLRFYEYAFKTNMDLYLYTAEKDLTAPKQGTAYSQVYGFVKDGNRVAFRLPKDAPRGTKFEWLKGESVVKMYLYENGTLSSTATSLAILDQTITDYLDFYAVYSDAVENGVRIKRKVPDMDFLLTDDNRLWGVRGNTIYGSKLGDPLNFYVFDGISTDSYSVDIGNAGDVTAVMNYSGYPTFFKEDGIYRLYGDKPSNFQIVQTMKQGVKAGCEKSLAVAGEVLYYISVNGIMAYSGGIPMQADIPLGKHIIGGVAASDGVKYYISATEDGVSYSLYVYDTVRNLWHKEDDTELTYAVYDNAALGLTADGELVALSRYDGGTEEDDFEWFVEFADMTFGSPFQKGVAKAHIRFDLETNAEARAEISYDGGEYELIREFVGDGKRSNVLPVIPHRCDHFRIRLRGTGICDIYAMALQYYNGSENY